MTLNTVKTRTVKKEGREGEQIRGFVVNRWGGGGGHTAWGGGGGAVGSPVEESQGKQVGIKPSVGLVGAGIRAAQGQQ